MDEVDGAADRPVAWTIVVLNRGWGARELLPDARAMADAGEGAVMLVYVVGARWRPRRLWLRHGRGVIRRALGPGGPGRAISLTVCASVVAGVALAADASGGLVLIRLGDARREAELRSRRISRIAVDVRGRRPGRGAATGPGH